MKHPSGKKRLSWAITFVVLILLGALGVAFFNRAQAMYGLNVGTHHCYQIILSFKQYSKDNCSMYPDSVGDRVSVGKRNTGRLPGNTNAAFHVLIRDGIVTDEQIFGCPLGLLPDGKMGTPPDFKLALQENENHWAITAGQTDNTVGNMPIVFENPAEGSWPPKWLPASPEGPYKPGSVREGSTVVVGHNDGSITSLKLIEKNGKMIPRQYARSRDLFNDASQGMPQRVLNIYQPLPPSVDLPRIPVPPTPKPAP